MVMLRKSRVSLSYRSVSRGQAHFLVHIWGRLLEAWLALALTIGQEVWRPIRYCGS